MEDPRLNVEDQWSANNVGYITSLSQMDNQYRPTAGTAPWHDDDGHFQSWNMSANRSYPNWEGTVRKNQNFPYGPNNNQAKLFSLMQLQSDPICSSAGCDQYKHPEKEDEPPRDYDVPDFGQDRDIMDSLENERVASK